MQFTGKICMHSKESWKTIYIHIPKQFLKVKNPTTQSYWKTTSHLFARHNSESVLVQIIVERKAQAGPIGRNFGQLKIRSKRFRNGPEPDIKIGLPPTPPHPTPPTRKLLMTEMDTRAYFETFLLRGNFFITQAIKRYSQFKFWTKVYLLHFKEALIQTISYESWL